FSETFTGILIGCRVENGHNNSIDGLEILINSNFINNILYPIFLNSASNNDILDVNFNNSKIINNSNTLYNFYLGTSNCNFNNCKFIGLLSIKQQSIRGYINNINNSYIDLGDNTISFINFIYSCTN